MSNPFVVILMGSPADRDHAGKITAVLDTLQVPYEVRIGSAHKVPEHVLGIVQAYEADTRAKVWVTIAGRSNALSAFVEAAVTAPVIACPPLSMPEDVWSSLRMPADVAPLVVLEPANAAIAAAKILGLADPAIAERVNAYRASKYASIIAADAEGRA
jgi:5-(carboxyamino)imidazole ribonucleotide mutase/phosphoribosylaminoimidazole-succinocarboxamide synthase